MDFELIVVRVQTWAHKYFIKLRFYATCVL